MAETSGKRILLAEDDRLSRRAVESMLTKRGFAVLLAADGEEAMQKAQQESPDLILLDVIMPKLLGFDVLVRLKADPATRDIPVVMMSSLGQEADVQEAMAAGALTYLVKGDVPLDQLATRIMAIFETMSP